MRDITIFFWILAQILLSINCSRINVTDVFRVLLPFETISYQVHSGYEDINWYSTPDKASIYYSLWESSTRRFADHSTPVIFYLAGGPGRSSQFTAFRQFGPIQITYKDGKFSGSENPWSWNYYAHLVFVDQPAGVGFSYNYGKVIDSTQVAAQHFVNFLWNFLRNSPFGLSTNPLYLAGEGYAGHFIPAIFDLINNNRTLGIKIEGVILGGAFIDPQKQVNSYSTFLGAAGIVSQRQKNQTNSWSTGGILKIRNGLLNEVRPWIDNIWSAQASQKYYNGMDVHNYKRYTDDVEGSDYVRFFNLRKADLGVPDNVKYVQFNNQINKAMSVDMFKSSSKAMDNLLASGKRVLIYNGQNDFIVNTAGVLTCLQSLEWPGAKQWRQSKKQIWREGSNISGWVKKYQNFIFVIVKGAGHYVYEDQSYADKSVYLMVNNYFSKKW